MNTTISNFRSRSEAGNELHRYAARFGFDRIAYVESLGEHKAASDAVGAAASLRWTAVSIVSEGTTRSIAVADPPSQCPISAYCLQHDKPFAWRYADPRFFTRRIEDGDRVLPVEKFMRRFHVGGAVTTPLHRSRSSVGIVSWMTSDAKVDLNKIVEKNGAELESHAQQFLDVVRSLSDTQPEAGSDALTARELECLRWTALGKTTDEIGELISRSGETARFHLKSAIRKLGATSRIHAVARASYYGLLGDIC